MSRLILTVDEAVQRARKWLLSGKSMDGGPQSAECDVLLKCGEYCVTFKSRLLSVHVDAATGKIMEPENGYLVTRR